MASFLLSLENRLITESRCASWLAEITSLKVRQKSRWLLPVT